MFKAHTESRPISQDRLEPATTAIGMVLAHGLAAGPLNEARMLLLQACQGADRRLVTPICTMIEARLLTSICSPRSGHTPLATARAISWLIA